MQNITSSQSVTRTLPSPRQAEKVVFPLDEILLLSLCGTISGCDSLVETAEYGEEKHPFPRELAPFEAGTDKEWIRIGVKLFAPLVATEIRVFGLDVLEPAKTWITSNRPKEETGAGAAIDHAVLPLEDKMPPAD